MDVADLGKERPFLQLVNDHVDHFAAHRLESVAEQVVRHRARRLDLLEFEGRDVKIDCRGVDQLRYGNHEVDLRSVEQLVDPSQTRAIGYAIHLATRQMMGPSRSLAQVLDELEALVDAEGLDVLDPFARPGQSPAALARPRRFEIAAAINRLRTLRVTRSHS